MNKKPKHIFKKCSCGKIYSKLPDTVRFWEMNSKIKGWFWNCECNSTLFLKEVKSDQRQKTVS